MKATPGQTLEITRDARLENIGDLREFVGQAAEQCGADDETCFHLKLAVDEACTNVVVHGYADLPPGPMRLTFRCDDGQLIVTLSDRGRPFDPTAAGDPDLESGWDDRQIGGLGIYLIRQVMDDVQFVHDPRHGNRLTLVKRFQPDRKSTRLNSSHSRASRMPSSA